MRRIPLPHYAGTVLAICAFSIFFLFFAPPKASAPRTLVSIPPGTTFSEAAEILKQQRVISSGILLRIAIIPFGGADEIQAGDYFFAWPDGIAPVAWRLAHGIHDLPRVRALLPEGSSSKDMGEVLSHRLPHIDAEMFAREARVHEGYLFPDTYFFLPTATSGEVVRVLRDTFDEKTAGLATSATGTPSFEDVVIMASLLEEEAKTFEDKQIVAGILWKRLREGQRLQVDAPFIYLIGKASHELTVDDLALDSPYNTYLYEGLTPTPISNPGLESIKAALEPVETEYWFYLSDSEGRIHYAKTFEEHKANKERYL
jgi:UPF0755 protein